MHQSGPDLLSKEQSLFREEQEILTKGWNNMELQLLDDPHGNIANIDININTKEGRDRIRGVHRVTPRKIVIFYLQFLTWKKSPS